MLQVFYFDVGENPRGRFLKVSEASVTRSRSTIIVPAGASGEEGWASFRNALVEVHEASQALPPPAGGQPLGQVSRPPLLPAARHHRCCILALMLLRTSRRCSTRGCCLPRMYFNIAQVPIVCQFCAWPAPGFAAFLPSVLPAGQCMRLQRPDQVVAALGELEWIMRNAPCPRPGTAELI